MATKNAFIFSWDHLGIESIIPISQYEHHEKQNLIRILSETPTIRNPLDSIVQSLLLRARYNTHRHYEIYAIDCTEEMDEKFWHKQWKEHPQFTAELIRERGHKLYSDRAETHKVKIT
jgi:hypothetical protein